MTERLIKAARAVCGWLHPGTYIDDLCCDPENCPAELAELRAALAQAEAAKPEVWKWGIVFDDEKATAGGFVGYSLTEQDAERRAAEYREMGHSKARAVALYRAPPAPADAEELRALLQEASDLLFVGTCEAPKDCPNCKLRERIKKALDAHRAGKEGR